MDGHDARKLQPAAQADLRRRVTRAVLEQGLSKAEAARVFAVSRTSVHHWLRAREAEGEAALESRPRAPAPGSMTKAPPAQDVVPLILDHTPDRLGLAYALWTREAVAALLAERFGVDAAIRSVGRYLKQWGLTPQKPLRRAYEQDPEAVAYWQDVEYPAIHRRAQREGAQIHWGDQMGCAATTPPGPATGSRAARRWSRPRASGSRATSCRR